MLPTNNNSQRTHYTTYALGKFAESIVVSGPTGGQPVVSGRPSVRPTTPLFEVINT